MPITPKPIIKALDSLDSFRPYERLLENDFQTSSTKIFLKKNPNFGGLETNPIHQIQT